MGLTYDGSLLNFFPTDSAAIWISILTLYKRIVVAMNFPKWPATVMTSCKACDYGCVSGRTRNLYQYFFMNPLLEPSGFSAVL